MIKIVLNETRKGEYEEYKTSISKLNIAPWGIDAIVENPDKSVSKLRIPWTTIRYLREEIS